MNCLNRNAVMILLIITSSFLISQDLSDLTLIAHYPLSSDNADITTKQDTMTLINTPFAEGGIYCDGIYINSGEDGGCHAVTPPLERFSLRRFAVSAQIKLKEAYDSGFYALLVGGGSYRWMYSFVMSDTLIGFLTNTDHTYQIDTWQTVTITFDSIAGVMRCYLDGTLVDETNHFINPIPDDEKIIGITHSGYGSAFRGYMKNLKIYSYTETEKAPAALEQDSLALVALYNSTDGPNWTNKSSWLAGPVSTWQGVTVQDGRVTELFLRDNNLTGTICLQIGDLNALIKLHLHENQLAGPIPDTIGNLINLTDLNLSNNQLTGNIPDGIGNLYKLIYLSLGANELSADFPLFISDLTELRYLYLSDCSLSGQLPENIDNLTELNSLFLSFNHLSGTIPSGIGNLINLTGLYLNGNQFEGSIPLEIGNLTNLNTLYLDQNQLTGSIPVQLANLANLNILFLRQNKLNGSVPEELGNLKNLVRLFLNENHFSGSLPAGFANMPLLKCLYLQDNQFSDLPDLTADTSLTELIIYGNRLTFEDIEPNISIEGIVYFPQDSIGAAIDTTIAFGGSIGLTVDVGGSANEYQWKHDGVLIDGAIGDTLFLSGASSVDNGEYVCRITNATVPNLTLLCRPIRLTVINETTMDGSLNYTPEIFVLHQNAPNPFNPSTIIRYELPEANHVDLTVYNLSGRKIRTLVNMEQSAGTKSVLWDGMDENRKKCASGIYLYQIVIESFVSSRKLILID